MSSITPSLGASGSRKWWGFVTTGRTRFVSTGGTLLHHVASSRAQSAPSLGMSKLKANSRFCTLDICTIVDGSFIANAKDETWSIVFIPIEEYRKMLQARKQR